jgi:hypothetical protein
MRVSPSPQNPSSLWNQRSGRLVHSDDGADTAKIGAARAADGGQVLQKSLKTGDGGRAAAEGCAAATPQNRAMLR